VLDFLSKIWCVLSHMDCYVLYGIKAAINGFVAALGAVVALAIAAIPVDMPDPPAMPDAMTTALSWVAWVFPIGTLLAIIAFFLSVWLMWQAIAVVLRWVKALD
jgi:hypothetical protein